MSQDRLELIKKRPDFQNLTLLRKIHEYDDVYSFIFTPEQRLTFTSGYFVDFLVYDLPPEAGKPSKDMSIASAPHEEEVMFSMHIREGSLYKQKLFRLKEGNKIGISNIQGLFMLDADINRPHVLLAGGIGITPFRSMILNVMYRKTGHDLTLVHVGRHSYLYHDELEVFDLEQHRTTREDIVEVVNDIVSRKHGAIYYISGPLGFVADTVTLLTQLGIQAGNLRTDEFTGYL